ncbi:MAG: efflux RND transporter periplasmic adaptor subunit [Alphaproteobacteria bacterium]|nr:efflux RND transporter periplasmic adaptor subunit [Alphaproteobacteria bacterium]
MGNNGFVSAWSFHVLVRLVALVAMVMSGFVILSTESNEETLPSRTFSPLAREQGNPPAAVMTLNDLPYQTEESSITLPPFWPEAISPASGEEIGRDIKQPEPFEEWAVEENTLEVDGVLVPAREAVISSSRDGKISNIPLQNGDIFKKNDILVRYDCGDLEAEAEIAGVEKKFTDTKAKNGNQLFKLDIISDVDRLNIETEDKQADAKIKLYKARLNDCTIRAGFDGRVTKRLANEGEYTRTDRVLLEVASADPLHVEFLLPSKWLRWVNIGAPIELLLNETGRSYTGKITRIYGEVDPVSRSIQVRAALDDYRDPLLSGMSGKVDLNIQHIKDAGVAGYLSLKN